MTAETGPPVLDPEPLRRLTQSLGADGPELVAELLEVFAQDAPRLLTELHAGLAAGDAATAGRAAHTLKGNAATLGLPRLEAACRAAETHAGAGDLDTAAAAAARAAREHAAAAAALVERAPPG